MKLLRANPGAAFLRHPWQFCLTGVLLMAVLFFAGCRGEKILGKNSVAGLKSQFSAYRKNQNQAPANTKKSFDAYLEDEKEHFNDVNPEFDNYKQRQGEDASRLKITLRRWLDAR